MRSIDATIQTLPEAIPLGNTGFEDWIIANRLAARMRLIITLPTTANPPVWGVGLACNVRSFGCARIERNDFGEHKLFVSHQEDTKAKTAGRTSIIMCIVARLPNQTVIGKEGRHDRCRLITTPLSWIN